MFNQCLINIDPRVFLIMDIYNFMTKSMFEFIFFQNNLAQKGLI